jgi:hypothetical protein
MWRGFGELRGGGGRGADGINGNGGRTMGRGGDEIVLVVGLIIATASCRIIFSDDPRPLAPRRALGRA